MTGENAERGEKGKFFIQFSFSFFPQVSDAENQNNYLSICQPQPIPVKKKLRFKHLSQ
jgi:hypothetical protein